MFQIFRITIIYIIYNNVYISTVFILKSVSYFYDRCQDDEHFNNYRLFTTLAFSIYNNNEDDDDDEQSRLYIGELLPDYENCADVLKKWKPRPHPWIEAAKLRLLASKEAHDVMCKVGNMYVCSRSEIYGKYVLLYLRIGVLQLVDEVAVGGLPRHGQDFQQELVGGRHLPALPTGRHFRRKQPRYVCTHTY